VKSSVLGSIFALGALLSVPAFCEESAAGVNLRFKAVDVCTMWGSFQDRDGRPFQGCTLYPRRMEIVDSFSLQQELTALERRIEKLEALIQRIEELESLALLKSKSFP
jgi:hypothetical protein